jgi:hypothetical protein
MNDSRQAGSSMLLAPVATSEKEGTGRVAILNQFQTPGLFSLGIHYCIFRVKSIVKEKSSSNFALLLPCVPKSRLTGFPKLQNFEGNWNCQATAC